MSVLSTNSSSLTYPSETLRPTNMGTGDSINVNRDSGKEYMTGWIHFIGWIRLWKKCLEYLINKLTSELSGH